MEYYRGVLGSAHYHGKRCFIINISLSYGLNLLKIWRELALTGVKHTILLIIDRQTNPISLEDMISTPACSSFIWLFRMTSAASRLKLLCPSSTRITL